MPFKKGEVNNPNGRPRVPEIELVRKAIAETEKEKKKSLWKHLIEKCYESEPVLIAVAKKFMPDQVNVQTDGVVPGIIILPMASKGDPGGVVNEPKK